MFVLLNWLLGDFVFLVLCLSSLGAIAMCIYIFNCTALLHYKIHLSLNYKDVYRDTACHCSYKKVGYMSTYAMLRITNE